MKKLVTLAVLLFVSGLTYTIFLIFQPQDLSTIQGRAEDDRATRTVDLPKLIETAALKSRRTVEVTERQVNTWLATHLKAKQEGLLADAVKLKGIWMRFEEEKGGRCEIIIEREIDGHPQTVSMYLRIERKKKENGSYTTLIRKEGGTLLGMIPVGGRFGQAKLPQGFLLFINKSMNDFAALFEQELNWLIEDITRKGAGKISFGDQKMRIDFPVKP